MTQSSHKDHALLHYKHLRDQADAAAGWCNLGLGALALVSVTGPDPLELAGMTLVTVGLCGKMLYRDVVLRRYVVKCGERGGS
jgi:hypothetical protein